MLCRLIKFEENYKFRDYESLKELGLDGGFNKGLGVFVRDVKEEFKIVEYVYVWYVFMGYWGGVWFNVLGFFEV